MTKTKEELLILFSVADKNRSTSIDVFEFVAVMQAHLPLASNASAAEQVQLVANLKEVFDQVDVNGDERMEWEELTSFIVETQQYRAATSRAPNPSPTPRGG